MTLMTTSVRSVDLPCSERLALWVLRRFARYRGSACGGQICLMQGIFFPCFREDFDGVAQALEGAFARIDEGADMPLDIASAGVAVLTPLEVVLLAATAAMQAGDRERARHHISRDMRLCRATGAFLSATGLLALRLAGAGHWLVWPDDASVMSRSRPSGMSSGSGEAARRAIGDVPTGH